LLLCLTGCSRQASNTLRWGGEASGGEPYIVLRDGQEPLGFEGELAEYFSQKLGMPTQFVPKSWPDLPQDLQRGDIDIIFNGYEWTPERATSMLASIPYYSYRLRLLVKKGSAIRDWSDIRPGMRIGVLKDSTAHRYVEEKFPQAKIEALGEEGVGQVMKMVADGNSLDATVQDVPSVVWFVDQKKEFPNLVAVGEPINPVKHPYYVIYLPRGAEALRAKLDEAIVAALNDGTLERIYSKYGLWDEDQKNLREVIAKWPPAEFAERPTTRDFFFFLLRAAGTTVMLALIAMPIAMALGLLIAVGRMFGPRWVQIPLAVYVEVIRGTPVLLQLAVIYYLLPAIGIRLDAFWAGVIGLGLNYAAYEAENYRAGLLAVPAGQLEAALALGMTRGKAIRQVVIPQAVRMVIPPVTNDFIALFKDTSVCSVVAVLELTAQYRSLMVRYPSEILQLGVMTAMLYLLMSYPLSLLARRLEQEQKKVQG
jgi:polar amino acid transport system substrate-binding protein